MDPCGYYIHSRNRFNPCSALRPLHSYRVRRTTAAKIGDDGSASVERRRRPCLIWLNVFSVVRRRLRRNQSTWARAHAHSRAHQRIKSNECARAIVERGKCMGNAWKIVADWPKDGFHQTEIYLHIIAICAPPVVEWTNVRPGMRDCRVWLIDCDARICGCEGGAIGANKLVPWGGVY